MANLKEAMDRVEYYMDKNIPVFIWGAFGIGKSDGVRQLVEKRKCGYIDFRASLRNPVDLLGVPTIDTKKNDNRVLQAG